MTGRTWLVSAPTWHGFKASAKTSSKPSSTWDAPKPPSWQQRSSRFALLRSGKIWSFRHWWQSSNVHIQFCLCRLNWCSQWTLRVANSLHDFMNILTLISTDSAFWLGLVKTCTLYSTFRILYGWIKSSPFCSVSKMASSLIAMQAFGTAQFSTSKKRWYLFHASFELGAQVFFPTVILFLSFPYYMPSIAFGKREKKEKGGMQIQRLLHGVQRERGKLQWEHMRTRI